MGELYKIKIAAEKLNNIIRNSNFSEEKKKKLYFTNERLKRWAREKVIRSNFSSNSYFISEEEFENILKLNTMITLEGKTIQHSKKELFVDEVMEKEEEKSKYGHVIDEALLKYTNGLAIPLQENTDSVENVGKKLTDFEETLLQHIGNMSKRIGELTEEVKGLKEKVEDQQQLLLENKEALPELPEPEKKEEDETLKENEEMKKRISSMNRQTSFLTEEMKKLRDTVNQQQELLNKQEEKPKKGWFSRMFSRED
ncbi:hypothetical protein BC2926_38840 [Bacillus cereus]|nr:hypothetical protein BC2926_38840 [Bacillus cereus]